MMPLKNILELNHEVHPPYSLFCSGGIRRRQCCIFHVGIKMNERIKQLADKAEKTYTYKDFSPDGGEVTKQEKTVDLEKFAELLVRECCELLKDSGESWEQFSRNPPQGQAHNASGALFAAYRLKEDAVDMLKEHFGIEE